MFCLAKQVMMIAVEGILAPMPRRRCRWPSTIGCILHWNVTEHPTAEWTIQQFRDVITPETAHRFVLHDRDSIFAATVDRAIASMGRHVLKTPVRTPQANAFCERVVGTIRR